MEEYFNALRKYNFWDGNVPATGFTRKKYTDKIEGYTGSKLVKVLVGQRRVGKSYLLRQMAKRLLENAVSPENILYVNKEYIELDFVKTYGDLENLLVFYRKRLQPKGKIYLFIDEIQNIEGWERFVNSHSQDFAEECELFISGSNSKMLSGELATLLSGRYVQLEVFPFCFAEYAGMTGKEISKQAYLEYLDSGGLPELFALTNEEARRNYVSAVKDTVLLRDIVQRQSIKDAKLLEDIFVYLANNASNLVSITNIVSYFKSKNRKTTYDTVANYVGFIEDAYLIHKVERYDVRGKNTIAGSCKYYVNDLSFKNLLYPGFGYGVGYKLENAVYLELRRAGFEVYVGTIQSKEVDFVAIKGDRKIYVQVAYLLADEQTVEREYAPLEIIPDSYEKRLITMDDVRFPSRNGIMHNQVWNIDL